eukprot:CAMPEP_0115832688 /NCGR_PEP_ID=MMETSP0287-20121206/2788_1 /TAXON_ID=412157 /ORGANISM="Chrysochromulina rotalis, Strain UIO044" /LENGTH=75 /DNA_ID=CAMNT_0003286083 /DNA_START=157 /DNA_END=380 /DNA_ORIENTATION=-
MGLRGRSLFRRHWRFGAGRLLLDVVLTDVDPLSLADSLLPSDPRGNLRVSLFAVDLALSELPVTPPARVLRIALA